MISLCRGTSFPRARAAVSFASQFSSSRFRYTTSTNRPETERPSFNDKFKSAPVEVPQGKSKYRRVVFRAAPLVILAAAGYYLLDKDFQVTVHHVINGLDRTSTVAGTTARCLFRYKMALSKHYESEEQQLEALNECHAYCANITYRALSRNGGVYIKFGQHLTALTYLLPKEWTEAMVPLQDQCPQSSIEEIRQLFEDDLGQSVDDLFVEFDLEPIGVASLAQVHTAVDKEGHTVAVKCQHPSLSEFVPLDLMLCQGVFAALHRIFPEYDLTWLGDELKSGIYTELDFNIEAENSRSTAAYFKNFKLLTALKVPDIYWASKRILIMEYVPGVRLDDLQYLDEHRISRAQVSSCLAHIFNNMIFTPGVGIHCDPHGGNLAIRAVPRLQSDNGHNFEVILYDHGQYRDVTTLMRRSYAKLWLALLDSNEADVKKFAQEFAGVSDEHFPLFAAAITGRDYQHAVHDVKSARTREEIEQMALRFHEGDFLTTLMGLLASLPRIVPLILKTNDLVRNLDERLENPLGAEKGFLIMASYCAQIVYYEDKEYINDNYRMFSLSWMCGYLKAWWKYETRMLQLTVYDIAQYVHARSRI